MRRLRMRRRPAWGGATLAKVWWFVGFVPTDQEKHRNTDNNHQNTAYDN